MRDLGLTRAIAASVGAALADVEGPPVVCITRDGSALMLGGDCATAVRYAADVTFVLCANGVWGGPRMLIVPTPSTESGLRAPYSANQEGAERRLRACGG